MKLTLLSLCLLACCITLVTAWSKEDQEIFRLRDEVAASEGPDVTFYDFLGVAPSANQDDINKAYKKRSRTLHPDKVKQQFIADRATGKGRAKGSKPGVHVSKAPSDSEIRAATKAASDRFSRLGLVTAILRGAGRERYDHFLSNGFPKWKGTGYYYARFRPGLGTVLTGLFIFVGGGGHYIALYMSWKRQQEFVGRYIKFARQAAWGDNLNIPGLDNVAAASPSANTDSDAEIMQPMNRRQRRLQEKDSRKEKPEKKSKTSRSGKVSPVGTPPVGAAGPKKRVVAENGKTLVVDAAGNVYLEQRDEEGETHEFLLDPNELPKPTIRDTALFLLPAWIYKRTAGQLLSPVPASVPGTGSEEEEEEGETAEPEVKEDSEDYEVLDKVKTSAPNGSSKPVKRSKKSGRK